MKQQAVFKRWLGGSNYTYNMALESFKNHVHPMDFNVLAFAFAIDTDRYGELNSRIPEWLTLTPSGIRKSILNELVVAHQTSKKNRMLGHTGAFTLEPKRKKNQKTRFSFPIPKESIKIYDDPKDSRLYKVDICSTKMKQCIENKPGGRKLNYPTSILDQCRSKQEQKEVEEYYLSTETLEYTNFNTCMNKIDKECRKLRITKKPKKKSVKSKPVNTSIRVHPRIKKGRNKTLDGMKINYDCRLCFKYGRWFIHIPYVRTKFKEPESNTNSAIALDPGFKTFQTFYSETECGKYQQDVKRLEHICSMLDYYQWSMNSKWHTSKYAKHKMNLLYLKQQHLMDDMHTRVINDLTSRYNWVLLPSFETQDMVKGKKGFKSTKRHASQLSHYKFKERLIHRCKQLEHSKVLIVSEAYTTKTCSSCGWIKNGMKTSERIFECFGECQGKYDRDLNASKNILLRVLTG